MPEHPTYSDDTILNVETHHEKSDVDVKALFWFVVIFVIFAAVTHVALWILFRFYIRLERRQSMAPLTAMSRPAGMNVPQEPRLQPFPSKTPDGKVLPPNASTPAPDMVRMRAAEDQRLQNYGWVDQQKGVVHIPIEEAKKRLLQRGLPLAPAQPDVATGFSPAQNGLKPVPTSTIAQPGAHP